MKRIAPLLGIASLYFSLSAQAGECDAKTIALPGETIVDVAERLISERKSSKSLQEVLMTLEEMNQGSLRYTCSLMPYHRETPIEYGSFCGV